MTEIKTDIGFARAFVRLALERKLLHTHLRAICGQTRLVRELYKRYAFLRSEDEREQFLYHILSLNAADFSCFTNTFIATQVEYEVLVVATLDRFASASVWMICAGTLGATSAVHLPPNSLQFTFERKNLGQLTCMASWQHSVSRAVENAHISNKTNILHIFFSASAAAASASPNGFSTM